VFGALAAGIPVVVVPLFADQFENGRRVANGGAGLIIEAEEGPAGPFRRVIGEGDAPRMAKGMKTVLATPSYRRRARRIAAEMATAQTVDEVLGALLTGAGAVPR
jgi:UDP:flavonoid glycosyltransferase YjiC (YdhE family)